MLFIISREPSSLLEGTICVDADALVEKISWEYVHIDFETTPAQQDEVSTKLQAMFRAPHVAYTYPYRLSALPGRLKCEGLALMLTQWGLVVSSEQATMRMEFIVGPQSFEDLYKVLKELNKL